ncbi:short-chain dehydrogenase reductase sdr [Trichoderma cornu-damae]|uniref:Short-chain dehydrogenase reductase sdr n=1 Tax=Trichoderma cornu-damae TaxID=654480 RepID=A0A9P8QET6_9HYPO|nr:short-chain dehydrogenase reductase sdr [Trichoderma cornu-damae]
MATWFADPAESVYNASKAALRVLSSGLAYGARLLGIKHLLACRTWQIPHSIAEAGWKLQDVKWEPRHRRLYLGILSRFAQVIYDVVASSGGSQGQRNAFIPALGGREAI